MDFMILAGKYLNLVPQATAWHPFYMLGDLSIDEYEDLHWRTYLGHRCLSVTALKSYRITCA